MASDWFHCCYKNTENGEVWGLDADTSSFQNVSSTHYNATYFAFEILSIFQFIAMKEVVYKSINLLVAIKCLLTTLPRYTVSALLSPPDRFPLVFISLCSSPI